MIFAESQLSNYGVEVTEQRKKLDLSGLVTKYLQNRDVVLHFNNRAQKQKAIDHAL